MSNISQSETPLKAEPSAQGSSQLAPQRHDSKRHATISTDTNQPHNDPNRRTQRAASRTSRLPQPKRSPKQPVNSPKPKPLNPAVMYRAAMQGGSPHKRSRSPSPLPAPGPRVAKPKPKAKAPPQKPKDLVGLEVDSNGRRLYPHRYLLCFEEQMNGHRQSTSRKPMSAGVEDIMWGGYRREQASLPPFGVSPYVIDQSAYLRGIDKMRTATGHPIFADEPFIDDADITVVIHLDGTTDLQLPPEGLTEVLINGRLAYVKKGEDPFNDMTHLNAISSHSERRSIHNDSMQEPQQTHSAPQPSVAIEGHSSPHLRSPLEPHPPHHSTSPPYPLSSPSHPHTTPVITQTHPCAAPSQQTKEGTAGTSSANRHTSGVSTTPTYAVDRAHD